MPSIVDFSESVTEFPNIYISPYGNDGVIPLYSSLPIDNYTYGNCLPCVVCGNSTLRQQIVEDEAQDFAFNQQKPVVVTKY